MKFKEIPEMGIERESQPARAVWIEIAITLTISGQR